MQLGEKSLTKAKTALIDYKTAIEQLPDAKDLETTCLEHAKQCQKKNEEEIESHQQELVQQQKTVAEMEQKIPRIQESIQTCNERIYSLQSRASDAEDDEERNSIYAEINRLQRNRDNLEETLNECEQEKKIAEERIHTETILIKKYQEKGEELKNLYRDLEKCLSDYSENFGQYRSVVTTRSTEMSESLERLYKIHRRYEDFSLKGDGMTGSAGFMFTGGAVPSGSGASTSSSSRAASGGQTGGAGSHHAVSRGVVSSKRTYRETEQAIKEKLPSSYHDGNVDKLLNQNGTITFTASTPKGTQKPDQYRFSGNTMYIKEEKNYKIENGTSSVVKSISDQLIKRIDCFYGATVPASVSGEKTDFKIEKMNLEYVIDLHGHYTHKDGSPVQISELNSIPTRIYEKVKNYFECNYKGKNFDDVITIRNNNLFSFGTNKVLVGV